MGSRSGCAWGGFGCAKWKSGKVEKDWGLNKSKLKTTAEIGYDGTEMAVEGGQVLATAAMNAAPVVKGAVVDAFTGLGGCAVSVAKSTAGGIGYVVGGGASLLVGAGSGTASLISCGVSKIGGLFARKAASSPSSVEPQPAPGVAKEEESEVVTPPISLKEEASVASTAKSSGLGDRFSSNSAIESVL